jgi:hypothetical protein
VLTTIKVLSKKGSTMIYIKITILWYFTKWYSQKKPTREKCYFTISNIQISYNTNLWKQLVIPTI